METICAISTPYGVGGIAVIRVSGDEAIALVQKLFRGKQPLAEVAANRVVYGSIVADDGSLLDQVLVSVMHSPHSFTGEDTVEISCHGSLYIQQEILRQLILCGCRMARAGEFTERAFLNGKMDLSEAEAVADLIASESKYSHQLAINQLRGGVTTELKQLRDKLLKLTSLLELELDFADHEELEFADRRELQQLACEIEQKISSLLSSFRLGNALKNGVPVAIIGKTNVGKSTLLNRLVGEDRAIVSNIHGTTRDTIEEVVIINGIQFRFIDTAGIRQTNNQIEEIGIERSKQAAQKAEIILHVVDATDATDDSLNELIDTAGKTVIQLYNKADLLVNRPADSAYISAQNDDLSSLKQRLVDSCTAFQTQQKAVISNVRHYEALQRAVEAIRRVQSGLGQNLSGELLSVDLQDCLKALGEITGEITSQEVLNQIFSEFCIGK